MEAARSEIGIILVGQGNVGSLLHLLLVLLHELLVDLDRRSRKGHFSNKFLNQVSGDPMGVLLQMRGRELTRLGLPVSLRASQRKGFSKL